MQLALGESHRHRSMLDAVLAATVLLVVIVNSPFLAAIATSPVNVGNGYCTSLIIPKVQGLESSIDQGKAVALAEQSKGFLTMIEGHSASYSGISDIATFDLTKCDVRIAEISVNFVLNDVVYAVINGMPVYTGFQVFEDASLTRVLGITVDKGTFDQSLHQHSGYGVSVSVGGVTQNLIASQTSWTQPSVTSVSQCTSGSPSCDLAIWSGLTDNGTFLAQTGTNANISCSPTCGAPVYGGFWQFTNDPPHYCSTSSYKVSVGDTMVAQAENGLDWFGGSNNQWETFLNDNTANWICSSGVCVTANCSGHTSTKESATDFERANVCGGPCHLAKFNSGSSVVMSSNQYCYGSLSGGITCQSYYSATLKDKISMVNTVNPTCANQPAGTNICLTAIDSMGRFSETWYTSAGT